MKPGFKIVLSSFCFGIVFWIADSFIDYYFFYKQPFLDLFILSIPPIEIFKRTMVFLLFTLFGFFISLVLKKRSIVEKEVLKFKTISDNAMHGNAISDMDGNLVYVNEYFAKIHGYNADELLGKNLSVLHNQDQLNPVYYTIESIKNKGYFDITEIWHTHKDGHTFPMLMNGMVINNIMGEPEFMAATAIDISDRVHVQEELKKNQRKHSAMLENISDVIVIIDKDAIIRYSSPNVEKWFGWNAHEAIGRHALDYIYPDDHDKTIEFIKKIQSKKGAIEEYICRYNLKDGTFKWVKFIANNLLHDPNIDGILVSYHDITDRFNEEIKQKISKIRWIQAQRIAKIGHWEYDIINDCIWGSVEAFKIYGIPLDLETNPDQILSLKAVEDCIPDTERVHQALVDLITTNKHYELEYKVVRADNGKEIIIYSRADLFFDSDNNPTKVIGTIQDISARKKIEEYLRENNQKMEGIFRAAPIGIGVTVNREILQVNDFFCEMLGYSTEELVGQNASIIYKSKEDYEYVGREKYKQIQEKGTGSVETQMKCKNEKIIDVFLSSTPIEISDISHGVVFTAMDITKRKKDAEQIQQDLQEKQVLLKEIHHRVKNNLQVISSLLNLQSDKIDDSEIAVVFNESKNRIYSMALVHEQLYKSDDLACIDMKYYIERLTRDLKNSFAPLKDIEYKINVENVFFDINQAIPCGLLLNELISNAFKHAFPNGDKGAINISLVLHNETDCKLTVQDDGVGIPNDFDIEKSDSLGMSLIYMLTKQLGGNLTVENDSGTKFLININKENPSKAILF